MKKIVFNISSVSNSEKEKVVSDLLSSGIAFQERHGMSVLVKQVASKQPEYLLPYFYKQLDYYRTISKKLKNFFYKKT